MTVTRRRTNFRQKLNFLRSELLKRLCRLTIRPSVSTVTMESRTYPKPYKVGAGYDISLITTPRTRTPGSDREVGRRHSRVYPAKYRHSESEKGTFTPLSSQMKTVTSLHGVLALGRLSWHSDVCFGTRTFGTQHGEPSGRVPIAPRVSQFLHFLILRDDVHPNYVNRQ